MKVSILFITYNHAAFIQKAIRSAMTQDYPAFELVVCDDCSKDDTRKLLENELANCPPHIAVVRAHSEKNVGLKANFNRGMAACTGDIVVCMSGDDVSEPGRLRAIADVFEKNSNCTLTCSGSTLIGPDDEILRPAEGEIQPRIIAYRTGKEHVFASSYISGATAAYRRDLHTYFGPLIPGNHYEDGSYWARALILGEIHFIPEGLIRWRMHHSNLSNNLSKSNPPHMTKTSAQLKQSYLSLARRNISSFRQWDRDFATALAKNPKNKVILEHIWRRTRMENETLRLLKYGITQAPWKVWIGCAWRLFKLKLPRPCVNTLIYAAKIRLSDKHRAAYINLHSA